jgi:DNA transformation protein
VPVSQQFLEFLKEQMAGFGEVGIRKMFGGAGVYYGGLMIGLIADEILYLKTDAQSAPEFGNQGLEPFLYMKNGKTTAMSYHRAPCECLDDTEEMAEWCGKAYAAARRSKAAPARKRRKTSISTGIASRQSE